MKIAVLGAGRAGSTVGRLWHAAGHDVTFTARHLARPLALAAELGDRAPTPWQLLGSCSSPSPGPL
jgi:8-hydroxy-5-deazaflavin:NADPH oxidoreductase